MMLRNKKGNFLDMFSLVEVLAVILFMGIFVLIVHSAVTDGFTSQPESVIPNSTTQSMVEFKEKYPFWIDMLFTGFLVMIFGFSIFAARLIPSSPKMIFVSIVFLIGGGMFGLLIENIWHPFTQNSFLASYIDLLVVAPFIMEHFFIVMLLFITAVSIALLSKDEVEQ